MDEKRRPHVQLVMDIGSILQQSVHHLGMSVLRGSGESCATVLPQKHTPERQWAADEIVPNHKSVTCCKEKICLSCAPTQPEQHIHGNTLFPFCLCMNHSLSYTTSVVIGCVTQAIVSLLHTFVWNSVEAPNSKRSFTTSL